MDLAGVSPLEPLLVASALAVGVIGLVPAGFQAPMVPIGQTDQALVAAVTGLTGPLCAFVGTLILLGMH